VTRLALYSREGCGLCEEMLEELAPWAQARGLGVEVLDVDADPEARRRYGYRVPVLLVDGEPAAHGRLELDTLERLLGTAD
jgi:thiol-disulfide isomerase/thioredoxin